MKSIKLNYSLVDLTVTNFGPIAEVAGLKQEVKSFVHGEWNDAQNGWLNHRRSFSERINSLFGKLATKASKHFIKKSRKCPETLDVVIDIYKNR